METHTLPKRLQPVATLITKTYDDARKADRLLEEHFAGQEHVAISALQPGERKVQLYTLHPVAQQQWDAAVAQVRDAVGPVRQSLRSVPERHHAGVCEFNSLVHDAYAQLLRRAHVAPEEPAEPESLPELVVGSLEQRARRLGNIPSKIGSCDYLPAEARLLVAEARKTGFDVQTLAGLARIAEESRSPAFWNEHTAAQHPALVEEVETLQRINETHRKNMPRATDGFLQSVAEQLQTLISGNEERIAELVQQTEQQNAAATTALGNIRDRLDENPGYKSSLLSLGEAFPDHFPVAAIVDGASVDLYLPLLQPGAHTAARTMLDAAIERTEYALTYKTVDEGLERIGGSIARPREARKAVENAVTAIQDSYRAQGLDVIVGPMAVSTLFHTQPEAAVTNRSPRFAAERKQLITEIVEESPGIGATDIRARLPDEYTHITTSGLSHTLRELRDADILRMEGTRGGARYFPKER